MKKRDLLISFSGGATSGYMAKRIFEELSDQFNLHAVFANTGQELEETLQFINECDKRWRMNVVWLEALVDPRENEGTKHKQVTFETADRKGKVFEEVIKKYGIPNPSYLHCTRELKDKPITSWAKENLEPDYITAIGLRTDEMGRIAKDCEERRFSYPLIFWNVDKEEVYAWWEDQDFQLGIENYRGNCSWCWKKNEKKHYRLIAETPEIYEFPRRMEKEYGLAGHNEDGTPRVFFRGNMSTEDLFKHAELYNSMNLFPYSDLDTGTGCEQHCQPFMQSS